MTDSPLPHYLEAGSGPRTVVLLHGIGGGAMLWTPTLPALQGWRTLAWDMPGYGSSPALPDTTIPALADALARMLDAAGTAQADLVGHSLGGMVALEFAVTRPDRVNSLVLYAAPAAFGGRDPAFAEAFLASRLGPLDAGLGMAGLAPGAVAALLGGRPDPAAAPAAEAVMAAVPEPAYRASLAALPGFDRRAALQGLACPVLLIAGEEDATAPFPTLHRMCGEIPDARFTVIASAGHLAHLEKPTPFNDTLRRFLEETGPA